MFLRPMRSMLAVAGLTLPALTLHAQSAPIPLGPSAVQEEPPSQAASPLSGQIQVQELATLNPNEVGLLDDAHGALGVGMWGGSSLGLISRALPLLPNQPGWRALRALEIRLLESPASLPAGKQGGESVIALRAGKLAAMGAVDGAAALLQHVPGPSMTPTLLRLQIDSALLSGDSSTVCAQEAALRAALPGDNYAAEVQIYCQFVAGKGNEAGLGMDLLREQKLHDPGFFAAADTLAGLPPTRIDWLYQATPVTVAMAVLAKLPLAESAIAGAPPAFLPAIVRATGLAPDTRLAAAERAVGLGILPPDQLRQLYEAVPLTAADLVSAGNETGKTPKSRALLYKAALQQPAPDLRAELIQRALSSNPAGAPLVYAPMLATLPASPDLATFAPWAVRALLAAGQFEAAKPWLGMLRAEGLVSGPAASAALKPLARVAGLNDPLTSTDMAAWRQARGESPGDASKRSLLLLCLLSALGDTPPEADWLAMLDGPSVIVGKVSRSALAVGLMTAAGAQRRGETALYALLNLGESRDAEPAEFARLIAALNSAGLSADARALAVELALAYGL